MAGLSVAAAAYMGRQALLAFVKFQASPPILRAFYKVCVRDTLLCKPLANKYSSACQRSLEFTVPACYRE